MFNWPRGSHSLLLLGVSFPVVLYSCIAVVLYCIAVWCSNLVEYRVSQKKRPTFERLLLPEYISNDILQHLIK